MNYKLHYEKLIERAKSRKLDCYKEVHHIIPKSMGGTNDKDNLVELTAREHFIAHLLLVKIHPESYSMIKALNMMCVSSDNQERSMNRMYGWLREKFSETQSKSHIGKNNNQYGTMWITNLEESVSKKIPKGNEIPDGWVKGRNITKEKYESKLKLEDFKKSINLHIYKKLGYVSEPRKDKFEVIKEEIDCFIYLSSKEKVQNIKYISKKFPLLSTVKISKILSLTECRLIENRGGYRHGKRNLTNG